MCVCEKKGAQGLKLVASFCFLIFLSREMFLGGSNYTKGGHRLKYIEMGIIERNRLNVSGAHYEAKGGGSHV